MSALVSEHSRFQIKEAEAGTPYSFRKANDLAYCVMCRVVSFEFVKNH